MRKIGDRVTERIEALGGTLTGTVVYIHPEEYFYTAEFEVRGGKFLESFLQIDESKLAQKRVNYMKI